MNAERPTREVRNATEERHEYGIYNSYQIIDATQQGNHQDWVQELDIHQISAGAYQGSCSVFSTNHLRVVHESQNQLIHKTGSIPKNVCTISLVYREDPSLRFSQFYHLNESLLFFLPEETEFDVKVSGGVETLYICLEQNRLLEYARAINGRFWEESPRDLLAFNSTETRKLASVLGKLAGPLKGGGLSPVGEKNLIDSLLLALDNSTEIITGDTAEYHTYKRANQMVKKAREIIDAYMQSGNIPSIVELCTELGVSERTLQYAFKKNMQLTPVAYLRILRLNLARTALLMSPPQSNTVSNIATMWGFFHLGKFSQDYRRMFGERPSETLARHFDKS